MSWRRVGEAVALLVLQAAVCCCGALQHPRTHAVLSTSAENDLYQLPAGFKIGAASSAYQTEGGWNEGGKGISIFDHDAHQNPDEPNGDVACDSYHNWREDVRMLKTMKVHAYRFSLAWSRILPTGDPNFVNADGIQFYNDLINELLLNGIEPMVTIYHLDYPQVLEDKFAGWQSPQMIDYFEAYARVAFQHFGDRVKRWMSLNEPHLNCFMVYGRGMMAPQNLLPGEGEYRCGHHLVLAHARAHRLLHSPEFAHQKGELGLVLESYFARPQTSTYDDLQAAERYNTFEVAWLLDPLFTGDYPPLMRRVVDEKSARDGLKESRMPRFTAEESKLLNGSIDFIGLNVYYGLYATDGLRENIHVPSLESDMGAATFHEDGTPAWIGEGYDTPWSIRESLLWLRDRYNNFPVFITECGVAGTEADGLDDFKRVSYYSSYLRSMLRAIKEDGCNVLGFIAWSLLDSFEWETYAIKIGLVHVDFTSPNKTRTLKKSGEFLQQIMTKREVPDVPLISTLPPSVISTSTLAPSCGTSILVSMILVLVSNVYNVLLCIQ